MELALSPGVEKRETVGASAAERAPKIHFSEMDSFVNELPDCGLSNRLLGAPLVPR